MSGDKHTAADHAYHGDAPRPVTKSRGVHVYLTPAEARTIALVFASVGGSPTNSLREHVQTVQAKLTRRGVDWRDERGGISVAQKAHGYEDAVYFKPYDEGGAL